MDGKNLHAGVRCVVLTLIAAGVIHFCGMTGSGQGGPDVASPDSDYDGRTDAQELVDGTNPLDATDGISVRLGYWKFNQTNWTGEQGQVAVVAANLEPTLSWDGSAVRIHSTNITSLRYRDVESNGAANINLRNGSVRFWFRPDWSGTNIGGTGPGEWARFLEVGSYSEDAMRGQWALLVNPEGTQIRFAAQGGGIETLLLAGEVRLFSNTWHEVVLTYSPTQSVLYLDGVVVTNGTGVSVYPNATVRAEDGLNIGSDRNGTLMARGSFDELETFNHALTAEAIAAHYNEPPSVAAPVSLTVDEDVWLPIPDVVIADGDAGTNAIRATMTVYQGVLSLTNVSGVQLVEGVVGVSQKLVIQGSITSLNTTFASLHYRGATNFNGTDRLDILVDDLGHQGEVGPWYALAQTVIAVEPVNDRPSIQLTSPTNGTTVNVGSTMLLSASAADVDGAVTNVVFWDGSTRLADIASPPYVWNWSGGLPGTHSIRAVATDDLGASSTSSVSVVSIQIPAQTNLTLWLKADSIVGLATGTGISQWPDSSGRLNHFVQSGANQRPVWLADGGNGIPVVRFDGGDDQMTGQRNPATNHFTAVLVLRATAWHEIDAVGSDGGYTGQRYIFGTKGGPPPGQAWAMVSMGNNGVSLYEDGNYVSGSYRRTALAVQSGDYSGGFQVVSISCSNSLQHLYVNGFYQQKALLPSQSNLVFSAVMGSSSSPAVGGAFAGDVAEVLVFDRTLTGAERLAVERYANLRYQLQANPPAAVTDLVGIAVGTNQIALTWSLSLSNGATGFQLERRTGAGEFLPIAQLPGGERSYFDTGLAPGQAYGYRVVPVNIVRDGSPSSEVIVVTASSGTGIPVDAMATWLRRGSGMTIDGSGRVSRWEDASGRGNHFSKSGTIALPWASRRGDGGIESLFLAGSEGLRAVRPCGTNSFTAFAVARTGVGHELDQEADYEGGNYFQRFVFFPRTTFTYSDAASGLSFATNGLSAYEGYNQQIGSFRMPSSVIFTNNLGNGRHIIGYGYENLYPRVFVDGSPVRSTWPRERTTVYGPYDLGGDGNNFGRSMIGDLYEVMVFDRVLTWEEQRAVHEYLNASFDVTTNLVAGPSISRPSGQIADEDMLIGPIPLTLTDRSGNPDGLILSARTSDDALLPAGNIVFGGSGMNRSVTIRPGTNQYGSAHVQLTVTDANGHRDYASFPVTVNSVNDAPVAESFALTLIEDSSIAFNLIGTDPEAEAISFQITQPPVHGTISGIPPRLVYVPATNYFGSDTLQYIVSDGNKTSTVGTVSITVLLGDDDPPTTQGTSITLREDQAKQLTLSASDPDGDTLSYVLTLAPSHGTLSGNLPTVVYTPFADYFGSDSFSFKARDAQNDSATATVMITVQPVNDAPRMDAIWDVSVLEDSDDAILPLSGIRAGPVNEIQSLAIEAVSDNTNLIESLQVTYTSPQEHGQLMIRARTNVSGTATVRIVLSDDGGSELGGIHRTTNSFLFQVQEVNDAPLVGIVSPVNGASFAGGLAVPVSASANDPDGIISLLEIYDGATRVGVFAGPETTLLLTDLSSGNHVLTAVAYDNAGLSSTSAPVQISVQSPQDSDYDGRTDLDEFAEGTNPLNPSSARSVRLASFQFDTPDLAGAQGQLPGYASGVVFVPTWSGSGAYIGNPDTSRLVYREVEPSGQANINLRSGSVRFWFQPRWAGTNSGGTGPGQECVLLSVGEWPVKTNASGSWALIVNGGGDRMSLLTASNGVVATNVTATMSWASNVFHQVVLTYSPTQSAIYFDSGSNSAGSTVVVQGTSGASPSVSGLSNALSNVGKKETPGTKKAASVLQQLLDQRTGTTNVVTNSTSGATNAFFGAPVRFYPGATVRASSGVCIGAGVAKGVFDRLETFNYPLSSNEVAAAYLDLVDAVDSDLDGLSDRRERELGTDPGKADSDGDGILDGMEVLAGSNPLAPASGDDPDGDGIPTWLELLLGLNPLAPGAVSDINDVNRLRVHTPLQ